MQSMNACLLERMHLQLLHQMRSRLRQPLLPHLLPHPHLPMHTHEWIAQVSITSTTTVIKVVPLYWKCYQTKCVSNCKSLVYRCISAFYKGLVRTVILKEKNYSMHESILDIHVNNFFCAQEVMKKHHHRLFVRSTEKNQFSHFNLLFCMKIYILLLLLPTHLWAIYTDKLTHTYIYTVIINNYHVILLLQHLLIFPNQSSFFLVFILVLLFFCLFVKREVYLYTM